MKDITEIKQTSGLIIKKEKTNGFGGTYCIFEYRNGRAKLKQELHFIFSWACGFEHLSVSTPIRTPTWNEMCIMKDIFWKDDEVCMQLHPAKKNYVNNMEYCLHIWRPMKQEIPTPPNLMVGIRNNAEDLEEDIKEFLEKTEKNGAVIDEETKAEFRMLGVDI